MMAEVLFLSFHNKFSFRLCGATLLYFLLFNVPVISGNSSQLIDVNQNQFHEWWIQSSVPTAFSSSSVNEKCFQHSQEYLTALRNRLPWAVQMYESSGRLVEDLIYIEGSDTDHHESGLFDECLLVESDGVPFQGQYCTVFFKLQSVEDAGDHINNFIGEKEIESVFNYQKPSVSFCLPSTCSAGDLNYAISQFLGFRVVHDRHFSVVAISDENDCYSREKIQASGIFDNLTIIILLTFCVLAVIITTATLHDILKENRFVSGNSFAVQLLHCFSAKRNCASLFSTEDSKDSLSCVHGIRVLTTCWIVLIHVGGIFQIARTIYNRQMSLKNSFRWEAQPLANGLFVVDTFFLISGLLVAFTQLRQLDQNNGIFNLKKFYFRRYIRLTPMYATVLAFLATLRPHIGTGPEWNIVQRISKSARKYWWAHMLYVNNYVRTTSISPDFAFGETWYLACDMQMFWLSPLFIYPIWRWKRTGVIWTAICLFVFLGASATVFIVYDLIPTILLVRTLDVPKIEKYFDKHYSDTLARIPPYLIGILLGWLLHKTKDRKILINKFLLAAGWMTSIMLALYVIYGMLPYMDDTLVPVINPWVRVSYGTLNHSAWAIAVGWIIFACTHGYGGFIHRFLSWNIFLPLSRMSYAVYLIHLNFAISYGAQSRKPFYVSELSMIITFFGILVIAFLLASVLTFMVEMPFLNLDKLFFPNHSKASSEKKKTT